MPERHTLFRVEAGSEGMPMKARSEMERVAMDVMWAAGSPPSVRADPERLGGRPA